MVSESLEIEIFHISPKYRFFSSPPSISSFSESGFVVLQGNTQWTEIFVRHFLFQNKKESIDSDDLLFFVRKKYVKGSNRFAPKVSHCMINIIVQARLTSEISRYHFSTTQKLKSFEKIRKSCRLETQTLIGKKHFT